MKSIFNIQVNIHYSIYLPKQEMKVFLGIWLSRLTFEKMPGTPEDIPTEQSLLVRLVDNRVLVRMR